MKSKMAIGNYNTELSATLSLDAIKETFTSNTLMRKSLIVEKTSKLFIGHVHKDGFKSIKASPICSLCVVAAQLKKDEHINTVQIEIKLHHAFIILLTI